jgi:hypothetical protein
MALDLEARHTRIHERTMQLPLGRKNETRLPGRYLLRGDWRGSQAFSDLDLSAPGVGHVDDP